MKNVLILGSTGSVGRNSLEVIGSLPGYSVYGLYCGNNIQLLNEQADRFSPEYIGTFFPENREGLQKLTGGKFRVLSGIEGILRMIKSGEVDILVIASSGNTTFDPLVEALRRGLRVATANKETLVTYYPLLKKIIPELPGRIIPVDSEHSAIYQSLAGGSKDDLKRVILPASGGPFYERDSFEDITVEDALNHPTWSMGDKITVDSATLMNKGLEIIEASVLFDLPPEKIKVVIHPQSIIHGMAEYRDGSIIAQLSFPDMKLPIQFALTAPDRIDNELNGINITEVGTLTFLEVNSDKFPFIELCYRALRFGGTLPAVIVTSDEVAVNAFLSGEIGFGKLMDIVISVSDMHEVVENPSKEDIENAVNWSHEKTKELVS